MENSTNKTIAKNTLFLYFRMMFTMAVALFTSRVVLQKLGVEDYGIYQTVGGVVSLLSFINGALSTGSSRFLTFELGAGNFDKLKRTFSTTLTVHIGLALFIVLVAETVGLWFVYNKLVIPADRLDAAVYAYHLSILASFFSITQVPYGAIIISHEKMNIYAYMSIIDVSAKLSIVYFLSIGTWDKLIIYSTLYCVIQIGMAIFYRIYCIRQFPESRYKFIIDKDILKHILGYTGWNLFANTAISLITQGTIVLINMFFNPSVVAARAIANQVNMAANQFVNNFRIAANPQIVKRYAVGDYDGSKRLLLSSTKYSYFMSLALCLPVCLVAKTLLKLWLGIVPEYSVVFLQLTIVTSLFQVFDSSFYTALYAKGQIKENAMTSPMVAFVAVLVAYVLFRVGYGPVSLAWVMLVCYFIIGLIVKPILLIKVVNYQWSDISKVFVPCGKVTIVALPIPCILYVYNEILFSSEIIRFLVLSLISITCVLIASWMVGINRKTRNKIIQFIKCKMK